MSNDNREPSWETPLEVLPVSAEEIPMALPAPARPQPGFWMSCLWSVVFLVLVNGVTLIVMAAVVVVGLFTPIGKDLMQQAKYDPNFVQSETFLRAMALALAPGLWCGQVISIIFALVMLRWLVGPQWHREIGLRRPSAVHMTLALIGLPAMMILANGVAEVVTFGLRSLGLPPMEGHKELAKMFGYWPIWFGVMAVGFGPGIGEELWCRGFMGRGLLGRFGLVRGVAFSSLLFGLMHINPPHAVAAAFMGVVFHLAYLASRSLWVSITLHIVNNSLGVLFAHPAMQVEYVQQIDNAAKVPLLVYLGAVYLLVAVGYAMWRARARLVPDGLVEYPWQPDFPGVQVPPPGGGSMLMNGSPGWLGAAVVLWGLLSLGFALWTQA
jgi:membrane protease YdiL (CAAX protease family)